MADDKAIDDETKTMLEDHVKKGKARKFVLICKGAAIQTLIVFKKGPYGPRVNKAKKAGFRGQAFCGVISGKGVNIKLQLQIQLPGTDDVSKQMKTEGNTYDGEPCKIAKLRAFFQDEASLKFKPEFTIIKSVADVIAVSELDDGEENVEAQSAVSELDRAEEKNELIAKLKKLTAAIQQALQTQPDRKDEIMGPAASIKQLLQDDELENARNALVDYATLLKEIIESAQPAAGTQPSSDVPPSPDTPSAPAPPPPPPPAPSASEPSPKNSEWAWRLKDLSPKIKKVLGEKLGDFGQIAAVFKQAQANKADDVAAAVELLKKCASMVDAALKSGEEEWTDDPQLVRDDWDSLSNLFPAQRQRVIQSLSVDQVREFDKLVGQAETLAQQGKFEEALGIGLQIAELDTQARQAATVADVKDSIPENVVEERKAFLSSRWQQAVQASRIEIDKLTPVLDKMPNRNAQEIVQAIHSALDVFVKDINNAIFATKDATSANMKSLDHAMQAIVTYRDRIKSDPLIQHLGKAKENLGTEVQVAAELTAALDDLQSRLAS